MSEITLRWMIRQVIETQCGILFDNEALQQANMLVASLPNPQAAMMEKFALKNGVSSSPPPLYSPDVAKRDAACAIQPLDDELQRQRLWWIFEIVPFHQSWQDEQGRWHTSWRSVLSLSLTLTLLC